MPAHVDRGHVCNQNVNTLKKAVKSIKTRITDANREHSAPYAIERPTVGRMLMYKHVSIVDRIRRNLSRPTR